MPLPRVLLIAAIALLAMLGLLWALNIHFALWLGSWLAPGRAAPAGFAIVIVVGTAMAYVYAHYIGSKFPGPGIVRGSAFGLVLAMFTIWALPPILHGFAQATGNVETVFQGRTLQDDTQRSITDFQYASQPTCAPIGGVEPPLQELTRFTEWAPVGAWRGRLLPFGAAFLLWGAVVGGFLSEQVGPRKT